MLLALTPLEEELKERPKYEVADIFREYGEQYRFNHPLPPSHLKVMRDIEVCRTSVLGGHLEQCDCCGFQRPSYNSCRNRHCPKCQALTKARWLEARKVELLPVTYFHNVFTLPHELNPLTLCNKKVVLNILFKSVSETLTQFGANPENGLGGKLGFTCILHTWDQTLLDHFHLHCLIPGGALSFQNDRWISAREDFLCATRCRIVECTQAVTHDSCEEYPVCSCRFPTRACCHRADDGVRSPADNVPKWVRMVTGEPLGESSPVKG